MERTPLIGIVAVALLGVAVAGGLLWGMSTPGPDQANAPDRPGSAPVTGSDSSARSGAPWAAGPDPTSVPSAEPSAGPAPGADRMAMEGAPEIPQAPPPPLDDPPGPPVYEPPPPGPLETPWEDAQSLLQEPVFDSLDAEGSYDDALARVQDRLDALDAVAARYQTLATASGDPATRDEARRLQADLYEQAAQSIPIVPPMVDGHEAWMEDHAEITGALMDQAARLRGE